MRFWHTMGIHRGSRRPLRWLVAAAILGGGGAMLAPRLHVDSPSSQTPAEPAAPVATLGPLPVALPDEPPQPARLSGRIETSLDLETPAGSAEQAVAEMQIPPCEPPPLGDNPWRPSTRVASFQAEIKSKRPPPETKPAASMLTPGNADQRSYLMHRIADGDTLSGLAQRYLGSSKRFSEIFAVNRDRLERPDLLPIGVEVRIPAKPASTPPTE